MKIMEELLMKKIRTVLALTAAVSVIGAGTAAASDSKGDPAISALISEYCSKTGCGSVSVAVITPGGTEYYGDAEGLYQIGSMTKAFTGYAVQKLIGEGKLDEEDELSELIPGFTAYYGSQPCSITVGQLLAQTSGYTNEEAVYPSASEGMTLMEWAMNISGKELMSRPGETYAYSNANYDLLGAVIEQVTGKPYGLYMKTEILEPLGLDDTYAIPPAGDARIISGSRIGFRHAFAYDIPVIEGRIPAGYFYSDAKDMAAWMRIWTGDADISGEAAKMTDAVKSHLVNEGDYYSGWEAFGNRTIGHSGGTPNYSSRMIFSDGEKIGVCVLTNINAASSTDGLANGIFSIVSKKSADGIPTDVWTVFDIIFSAMSIIFVLLAILIPFMKRHFAIAAAGGAGAVLLTAVCTVMPAVFGADLKEIAFIWAPYSFALWLAVSAGVIIAAGIKLWNVRKDENNKKTGGRTTADGHNRIPGVE